MGQKVNPVGFRLGTSRDHDSMWFAKSKDYSKLVMEDIKVRERIKAVSYTHLTLPTNREV